MTHKQAIRGVNWLLGALGLRDWEVFCHISDERPDWVGPAVGQVGACEPQRSYKKAVIWVSPQRCEADNCDLLGCLFHEILHILASDIGLSDNSDAQEYAWNQLGDLLARAYRAGVKP